MNSHDATGSLTFKTHFKSTELDQLELPIEIRHPDLKIARRGVSSQSIEGLRPGAYLVIAKLPAGQVLTTSVDVAPHSRQVVDLEPDDEDTSPHESDEVPHFISPGRRAAFAETLPMASQWAAPVAVPEGTSEVRPTAMLESLGVGTNGASPAPGPSAFPIASSAADLDFLLDEHRRLYDSAPPKLELLGASTKPRLVVPHSAARAPAVSLGPAELYLRVMRGNVLACQAAPVSPQTLGITFHDQTRIHVDVPPGESPTYLQLLLPDRSGLNVTVPTSRHVGCKVVLSALGDAATLTDLNSVTAEVQLGNGEANALLHYRAAGYAGQAATTVASEDTAMSARKLFSDKDSDPVAAAVGAYALLQLNRLERLHSWAGHLYERFPWLPDGAAIYGEHCARAGKHRDAADAFLSLAERGLPFFSEGLKFASERLELYLHLHERGQEGPLDPNRFESARLLLELLQRFAPCVERLRLIVRFPGLSPNAPGSEPFTRALALKDGSTMRRLRFESVKSYEVFATPPAATLEQGPAASTAGDSGPPPRTLLDETDQRFAARATERRKNVQKIDAVKRGQGRLLEVDDPQRVALRTQRLLSNPALRAGAAASAALETLGTVRSVSSEFLERIIGGNNLLGIAFLEVGAAVARTVGRIHIKNQFQARGFGTGFLVSPRLVLTNNHVLPSADLARFSTIEFDFQIGPSGKPLPSHEFRLSPEIFFVTDTLLDFSLVAVESVSDASAGAPPTPLSLFGFNRLNREQGKVLIGESINVIQHPDGEPKQVALQQNELVDRLDHFLHYRTDISPGSSGAPLFNNQWELVGLHHSGVPARDANGSILSLDGTPWQPSMGESKIQWLANEGIRISSIIARVAGLSLSAEREALRDEFLNAP